MTQDGFRRMALALADTTEAGHMGHPDFRVGGRIFATLGYPDAGWGMVKLTPEQQQAFVDTEPKVFAPAKGAWGRGGATCVRLDTVTASILRAALAMAWQNLAAKPPAPRAKSSRKKAAPAAAKSPKSPRRRSG